MFHSVCVNVNGVCNPDSARNQLNIFSAALISTVPCVVCVCIYVCVFYRVAVCSGVLTQNYGSRHRQQQSIGTVKLETLSDRATHRLVSFRDNHRTETSWVFANSTAVDTKHQRRMTTRDIYVGIFKTSASAITLAVCVPRVSVLEKR